MLQNGGGVVSGGGDAYGLGEIIHQAVSEKL